MAACCGGGCGCALCAVYCDCVVTLNLRMHSQEIGSYPGGVVGDLVRCELLDPGELLAAVPGWRVHTMSGSFDAMGEHMMGESCDG